MSTPTLDTLLFAAPVLIPAGYAAWYALLCAVAPFGDCRRCKAHGWLPTRTGRPGRTCPRCHGGRRRVRVGRRLYEYYRREYRDGHASDTTSTPVGARSTTSPARRSDRSAR